MINMRFFFNLSLLHHCEMHNCCQKEEDKERRFIDTALFFQKSGDYL